MKIPEIPGSYQPGDVVNGHVLTERGHWVELGNDRAAGLRRRYLSTNVSTVRDPDKPSSELSGTERQAAAYSASHTPTPPPPGPPPSPGPTYSQGPPDAQGPSQPPGPTYSAGPPRSAGPTPAQGPSPYTASAPGGPTSGPQQQPQKKNGCAGCLVVAVVVLAAIGLIVAALSSAADRLRADADSPGEIVWEEDEPASWDEELADVDVDIPEMRQFRLDDEELALVELEQWEVFHAEYASHYVLTIGAPGLERPHANLSISVEATDEDGVVHEFTESVTLRWGMPVTAVGYFRERLESEIVDLDMTITTTFAHDGIAEYTPWVETYTVDTSGIRSLLTLDLVAEGDGAPSIGRLTTVVRDEEGQIINVGSTYLALPEPGTTVTVELYLWGEEPVLDDDDVDFSLIG